MKLTKEEFKKLIFEDENTDAQPAESSTTKAETGKEEPVKEAPAKTEKNVDTAKKTTEKTPTLSEVLKNNGWSGEKNTYTLSTDKYNYEIKLPTTNESRFINLVRKLILEETSTKLEVKITDSTDKKDVGTYKIDYTTDYTKIENQLKEIISNVDAKKDDKKEEAKEKHILDIINSAYDKLSDEEQHAFNKIYGEKLLKTLAAGKK